MRRVFAVPAIALMLLHADLGFAIDSYRYLHVSIETPWMIFLFLLVAVFAPFILMVVLMWWGQMQKQAAPPKSDIENDE
jgi:hypothetical protein